MPTLVRYPGLFFHRAYFEVEMSLCVIIYPALVSPWIDFTASILPDFPFYGTRLYLYLLSFVCIILPIKFLKTRFVRKHIKLSPVCSSNSSKKRKSSWTFLFQLQIKTSAIRHPTAWTQPPPPPATATATNHFLIQSCTITVLLPTSTKVDRWWRLCRC